MIELTKRTKRDSHTTAVSPSYNTELIDDVGKKERKKK
jgi:hypothetical protein